MVSVEKEGEGIAHFFGISHHGLEIKVRGHSRISSGEPAFGLCKFKGDDCIEFPGGPEDPWDHMFDPCVVGHDDQAFRLENIKYIL